LTVPVPYRNVDQGNYLIITIITIIIIIISDPIASHERRATATASRLNR